MSTNTLRKVGKALLQFIGLTLLVDLGRAIREAELHQTLSHYEEIAVNYKRALAGWKYELEQTRKHLGVIASIREGIPRIFYAQLGLSDRVWLLAEKWKLATAVSKDLTKALDAAEAANEHNKKLYEGVLDYYQALYPYTDTKEKWLDPGMVPGEVLTDWQVRHIARRSVMARAYHEDRQRQGIEPNLALDDYGVMKKGTPGATGPVYQMGIDLASPTKKAESLTFQEKYLGTPPAPEAPSPEDTRGRAERLFGPHGFPNDFGPQSLGNHKGITR